MARLTIALTLVAISRRPVGSMRTDEFGLEEVSTDQVERETDMQVEKLMADAEFLTWLNTSLMVGFDSNEHKDMGDKAWAQFRQLFLTRLDGWAAAHGLPPDGQISGGLKTVPLAAIEKGFSDTVGLYLSGGGDGEDSLTFGDFCFLCGDFFADEERNGGNLLEPSGNDFLQKDPVRPLEAIHWGYEGYVKPWVPALVRYVRRLAAMGAEYDSANTYNFIERQARFVALTGGRYKRLAYENSNHFGILAEREYERYQKLAISTAHDAGKSLNFVEFRRAFTLAAMGSHYLTDLFSGGHVRVPRTQLVAICTDRMVGGVIYGTSVESKLPGGVPNAGFLTKMMHDEDSLAGVVQEGIGVDQWKSYGDSTYFKSWSTSNREHILLAMQEALTSVLYAFLDGVAGKALKAFPPPVPRAAEHQPLQPMFKWSQADRILRMRSSSGRYIERSVVADFGNSILDIPGVQLDQCKERCDNTPACKSIVFANQGQYKGYCRLMDKLVTPDDASRPLSSFAARQGFKTYYRDPLAPPSYIQIAMSCKDKARCRTCEEAIPFAEQAKADAKVVAEARVA